MARRFAESADAVIDATDRYVVPGGVDAHTHFGSEGQIAPVLDTFRTGTVASRSGPTTVLDFAVPRLGERITDAVERHHGNASGECAVDYGFHVMTTGVDQLSPKEMDVLVDDGVTSFKMFMAYPGTLYSDDAQILRMMQQSAMNGGLIMMHAENGIAMDLLRQQAVERGHTDPVYHSLTRPPVLEAEAVHRAAALAHVAGVPVYIVHLSSGPALEQVALARDKGWNVFAETCPQYLFLDLSDLERPDFDGSKYVCSPPLRPLAPGGPVAGPAHQRPAGGGHRSLPLLLGAEGSWAATTSAASRTVCPAWSTAWSRCTTARWPRAARR